MSDDSGPKEVPQTDSPATSRLSPPRPTRPISSSPFPSRGDLITRPLGPEDLPESRTIRQATWTPLQYEEALKEQGAITQNVHGRRVEAEERAEQGQYDALTGLVNQKEFRKRLTAEIARAKRYGHRLEIVIFDLDLFKAINDRYGHLAGNNALVMTSAIMRALERDGDTAARWGGDEFANILVEPEEGGARIYSERLHRALTEAQVPVPGGSAPIGATIGIATFEEGDDAESLLNKADQALLIGKKVRGKNAIVSYDEITETDRQELQRKIKEENSQAEQPKSR